jgi:hypothetical protein
MKCLNVILFSLIVNVSICFRTLTWIWVCTAWNQIHFQSWIWIRIRINRNTGYASGKFCFASTWEALSSLTFTYRDKNIIYS